MTTNIVKLRVNDEDFELRATEMVKRDEDDTGTYPTIDRLVVTRNSLNDFFQGKTRRVQVVTNYWNKAWEADKYGVLVHEDEDGMLHIGCKNFQPEYAAVIKDWATNKAAQ